MLDLTVFEARGRREFVIALDLSADVLRRCQQHFVTTAHSLRVVAHRPSQQHHARDHLGHDHFEAGTGVNLVLVYGEGLCKAVSTER